MRSKLLLAAAVIALVASCKRNENRIFCLIASDADTVIREDCEVLRNGVRIGKLQMQELSIYPRRPSTISGYIELDRGVCVPDSSSFKLCNAGLIANKPFIMVISSKAARCLTKNDTILVSKCAILEKPLVDSTTVKLVDSLMRHLKRTYFNR